MRHPNEYWLKYIITFSTLTDEQILDLCNNYGMVSPAIPDKDYLQRLRRDLDSSKPTPFSMKDNACKNWIRRQRIMSLAAEEKDALRARDILSDNRVRPAIEMLIISDMPTSDIVKNIQVITGKVLTEKTIDFYKHYFWNRDLLSIKEWFEYFKLHPVGWSLKSSFTQGPEHALWKLGVRVEQNQEEVLRAMFNEASMRFFETTQFANTKDTALAAKMWAETLLAAKTELDKSGDAVNQVLAEVKEIAIRLSKERIKSYDELDEKKSDGNAST